MCASTHSLLQGCRLVRMWRGPHGALLFPTLEHLTHPTHPTPDSRLEVVQFAHTHVAGHPHGVPFFSVPEHPTPDSRFITPCHHPIPNSHSLSGPVCVWRGTKAAASPPFPHLSAQSHALPHSHRTSSCHPPPGRACMHLCAHVCMCECVCVYV